MSGAVMLDSTTLDSTTLQHAGLPQVGLPHVASVATAAPRWLEVVSHLDPSYGGLSSAVPALGRSLAASLGGMRHTIDLTAFCVAGEHFTPEGYSPANLSFWPAARGAWLRDRLHGNRLHQQFFDHVHGAQGVHIHGLWEAATSVATASARQAGVPYILSAHGMLEPWALDQKRVKKLVYAALVERGNVARARCLHALTRAEARQFADFGARSPIAVIPNAVDVPLHAQAESFLEQFPALLGKRIVLYIGRLHPKKGLDLLIDAWSRLAASFPAAHLVLAGPDCDGTRTGLEDQVARSGVGDSVLFAGMLRGDMKWSALAAAEAFVLPSWSEGLSMSALEAMGMGLPVIVTRPCNMPEVLEHAAGWEIEPDREQLTAALRELLRNEQAENAAIGRRGAGLIVTRYTPAVVARQMSELYAWAAGGKVPASVDLIAPGSARVYSTPAMQPNHIPAPARERTNSTH
jgi:glycosyltransferase involved in cell wall biosynthesis